MPKPSPASAEKTWALGSVSRLTGLSPELLRAWERRHRAVEPLRTPGGTRRYRASDLERLRLLKSAVDAGHRIGELAALADADLAQLASEPAAAAPPGRLEPVLAALDALDGAETQRLLALQLSALGAVRFAREVAMPLAREIGERWAAQRMGIAAEHLATAVLRSLLGSALQPGAAALRGARVVFATLAGERHELGLLMAALAATGAGANPIYLGPDVPADDLIHAARQSGAAAVALSLVGAPPAEAVHSLAALRRGLPSGVQVWIGGAGAARVSTPHGVERIESLEQLEQRVGLLGLEKSA
jgi:DNA-binding transcriptional MerR regulator/methylmalonyl-CoA mutase cobalamin-binding subunit